MSYHPCDGSGSYATEKWDRLRDPDSFDAGYVRMGMCPKCFRTYRVTKEGNVFRHKEDELDALDRMNLESQGVLT